jgi:putative peptide zinc metalloprotease protein
MQRRLVAFLAVLLAAFGLACARPALGRADDGGGGANTAIAINTKDGSSVFKLAFAIRHVMNGVVDQANAAVAVASCTDCTTIAVAIEIVLVESNASVVTPTNVALAFNDQCVLCVTAAEAFQFVLGTGGPVHFDAEGNRMLNEIRHELHDLKKADVTLAELQTRLDAIAAQIKDVLANHLVPAGKANEGGESQPPAGEPPPPTTTTTGTTPTATTPTTTTTETGTASTPTGTTTTTTTTP